MSGAVVTLAALGALAGAGLWLTVRGLVPRRPSLAETLAAMDYEAAPDLGPAKSLDERVGRLLARLLGPERVRRVAARNDLALLDMSETTFMGSKVASAVAALLVGPAFIVVAALVGIGVRWQLPAVASLALGGAGWFIPDVDLKAKADKRRRAIRRELSGFVDVVNLALASNELISGALHKAAYAGDGYVYRLMRRTLDVAAQRGVTPWEAIAQAGEERNIEELSELAASVRVAGTDGASIRRTLTAKAAGLRARAVADKLVEANGATTKMVLPMVGFAAGFMLLVLYPPIANIAGGG